MWQSGKVAEWRCDKVIRTTHYALRNTSSLMQHLPVCVTIDTYDDGKFSANWDCIV